MIIVTDCGCMGILLHTNPSTYLRLRSCTHDGPGTDLRCECAPLGDHTTRPATPDEAKTLVTRVGNLMGDGERFRQIRDALNYRK